LNLKQLVWIAMFIPTIFALEYVMMSVPNIQLTFVLMLFYVHTVDTKTGFTGILVYTIIKSLVWGFSLFTPIAFVSWCLIFLLKNKQTNYFAICLVSVLMMWLYAPLGIYIYGVSPIAYLLADFPFTVIFVVNNVLTTLWLYPQLQRLLKPLIKRTN